jgi:hypothetical protein
MQGDERNSREFEQACKAGSGRLIYFLLAEMSVGQFGWQPAGKFEYSALTSVRTRFEMKLRNAISSAEIASAVYPSLRMMDFLNGAAATI